MLSVMDALEQRVVGGRVTQRLVRQWRDERESWCVDVRSEHSRWLTLIVTTGLAITCTSGSTSSLRILEQTAASVSTVASCTCFLVSQTHPDTISMISGRRADTFARGANNYSIERSRSRAARGSHLMCSLPASGRVLLWWWHHSEIKQGQSPCGLTENSLQQVGRRCSIQDTFLCLHAPPDHR